MRIYKIRILGFIIAAKSKRSFFSSFIFQSQYYTIFPSFLRICKPMLSENIGKKDPWIHYCCKDKKKKSFLH